MVTYIPYPKAIKSLVDRFNATPEELAAWVWMTPKNNGLAAYLNANELDPPPRFFYEALDSSEFDYIPPLMACWFKADDIASFKPIDRYITGAALIERWESQPNIQPKDFIQAKIEEARLSDFHPLYGGTQASSPEGNFPPLESGLFLLAEIELIEIEEFSTDSSTRTSERNKNLQCAARVLADEWKLDSSKKITKRDIALELAKSGEWRGMNANRIERIILVTW